MRTPERILMVVTFLAAAAVLAGALADTTNHTLVGVRPGTTFDVDWCDGSTTATSDSLGILAFQTDGDPGPCWASICPSGTGISGGSCDWRDRTE